MTRTYLLKASARASFAVRRGHRLTAVASAAIAGAVLLSGCGGGGGASRLSDDALADLRSKELTPEERIVAVDRAWAQAQAGTLDIGAVREQFKSSLFLLSSTDDVRLRILETLLTDERPEGIADTRNVLRLRLPREDSWPIIQRICDESVKNNWTEMTPALVRSYSRKVNDPPDDQRPERAALLALNPGQSIEEIVYDVFVTSRDLGAEASDSTRYLAEKARTDAWDLLGRLDKDGSKRTALLASDRRPPSQASPSQASPSQVPPSPAPSASSGSAPTIKPPPVAPRAAPDTMLADLRAAAKDLRAVPVTGQELEWVRTLRSPGNSLNEAWWKEATAALAGLTSEQALGLEVRHAEPVRWAAANRPEWLSMSRGQIAGELAGRLRGRLHNERSSEDGDFGTATPETLDYWDAKLVWGDFLAMLVIDEALRDPGVVAALFEQAAKDRENTKTEMGGVIEAAVGPGGSGGAVGDKGGGGFEARDHPPQVGSRSNDNKYIASERMIASTPRCLAHYHFHAQKEKNTNYAGPSNGDLEYAATYARNCLVFTSVGRGVLGVDYYQRNKARIDLGEIRLVR